jgi:hypothetical protein
MTVLQPLPTNHRISIVPSMTIRITLLTVVLAVAGACSKPQDAKSPAAPASTAEAPLYAYAQTNDLRVAPQLIKGWYQVEEGGWRWMAKESLASLKNPQTFPAQFEVRLVLPKGTVATVGGPVTFTVLFNDKPFGEETYSKDGSYVFQKSVPPGTVTPGPINVTLRVNRAKPPVPNGDIRELGALVEGFGFR